MQNTIKREIHDFILKSCKEAIHDFSYRNNQMAVRDASIIEKYFFEGASPYDLTWEFKIAESNVSTIINRYLEHLSSVASHGGYTSDEIDFISTLLGARRSTRKAFKECVEVIAQCKNGSNQNKLVFSISDSIEKLYELNLISHRTLNCLLAEFGQDLNNHPQKVTIADIVYIPKMRLYSIPNMGDKSIAEIVGFMIDYSIQGRIIPTKEDIKRVLDNTNLGIDITRGRIIDTYYLTDMFVDAMCIPLQTNLNRPLQTNLNSIQTFIGRLLSRVCESVYMSGCLLDLITVSTMLDLWAYRRGTYRPRDCYYIKDITNRIRELCHSKE